MRPGLVYGRRPLEEALSGGLDRLYVHKGGIKGSAKEILSKARGAGVPIIEVERTLLDDMTGGANHQGLVGVREAYSYTSVSDILTRAKEAGEDPFIVLLDGVQDPHNLGAIARSALALGAHGLVIPKNRAAGASPGALKSSAGALEVLPLAQVTNLTQEVLRLKEEGLWFYGADMGGQALYDQDLTGPMGLVLGSEGRGISKKLRGHMDFIVSIPMAGGFDSLNVSVAGAILMYERARQVNEG